MTTAAFRARRRALAAKNRRNKAKYLDATICARPYCYRKRWNDRTLCRRHTLQVHEAMGLYRDSGKANLARWKREMRR